MNVEIVLLSGVGHKRKWRANQKGGAIASCSQASIMVGKANGGGGRPEQVGGEKIKA